MLCFFFQAEDGIRDGTVTGVQTCALPISGKIRFPGSALLSADPLQPAAPARPAGPVCAGDRHRLPARQGRSEERRVGKECRSRWSADHQKKSQTSVMFMTVNNSALHET